MATRPPHSFGDLLRTYRTAAGLTQEELAQRNHDLQVLCWVKAALAEWDLLAGRPEAARVRLVPLLDAPGPVVSYSKEALSLLAWTYLEVGEADQAQALLAQVLSTAR